MNSLRKPDMLVPLFQIFLLKDHIKGGRNSDRFFLVLIILHLKKIDILNWIYMFYSMKMSMLGANQNFVC